MAEEKEVQKSELKKERKVILYNLDQFLIITKIVKNNRLYYEKVFGFPYKEQTLKEWSEQTGIKFEE